jgi:hypothetical protein
MKTLKIYSLLLLLAVLSGCMDVIDKPDPNSAGSYIWDSEEMATLYLDKLYLDNLPGARWGSNMTTTDEAYGLSPTLFLYGRATVSSAESYSQAWWAGLRRINIMIKEVNEVSTLPEATKNRLIAQARFLRAVKYWELVRLYGGIPILRKPLDPLLDDLDVPRSTTAACVAFIVEDLDFAIANLPMYWDTPVENFGRLTKAAAMAYKGRVLLHVASPMFCERDAYTADNGQTIEAFKLPEATIKARWEAAYAANKVAWDSLTANGYGLLDDFGRLFTTPAVENKEAVMVRLYTGINYTHGWEAALRPYSEGGSGDYINPMMELVNAFSTREGLRITDAGSGYEATYYWLNRDPRFYHTLAYNGGLWNMGAKTNRKQWVYFNTSEEGGRISQTGFYCRKAADSTLARENLSRGKIAWQEIRMAEVLLNLAESANELYKADGSHPGEAATLVRQLRQRAGILPGDGSYGVANQAPDGFNDYGEYMLDVIMNERQVELAFEDHRYWDMRRRMMYTRDLSPRTPKLNGQRRTGLRIFTKDMTAAGIAAFEAIKDTLTLTKDNYLTYFRAGVPRTFDYDRNQGIDGVNYLPGYYFMPISPDMFSNSTKLVQTLGWGYGTFDALAE